VGATTGRGFVVGATTGRGFVVGATTGRGFVVGATTGRGFVDSSHSAGDWSCLAALLRLSSRPHRYGEA